MIFRHYKGGKYRVLFHAAESTNERVRPGKPSDVVVYVSLATGKIHVRDRAEFYGMVTTGNAHSTTAVKRFEEVEP